MSTATAHEAAALDEGVLATLLGWRVARARQASDRAFQVVIGEPLGLRPVEYAMLALAAANPGVGPAQLARALAISRPQATQCLDRLEQRGLLRREPSASDGRSLAVLASPAGRRLLRDTRPPLLAAEQAALAAFTPAERAMLFELLGKLAAAAMPPGSPFGASPGSTPAAPPGGTNGHGASPGG
jgi:DNA-binding MarR family transcriptional regulator